MRNAGTAQLTQASRSKATLLRALFVLTAACHDPTSGPKTETVHIRWSQAQVNGAKSRPLVSNNLVYFGTGTGDVIARDFETGAARWSTQVVPQSGVAAANLILRKEVYRGSRRSVPVPYFLASASRTSRQARASSSSGGCLTNRDI
jgi:outer membrane protein assembly factor BamB